MFVRNCYLVYWDGCILDTEVTGVTTEKQPLLYPQLSLCPSCLSGRPKGSQTGPTRNLLQHMHPTGSQPSLSIHLLLDRVLHGLQLLLRCTFPPCLPKKLDWNCLSTKLQSLWLSQTLEEKGF
nr:uncharacterized protein LOC110356877 isoform X4 [Columba livia]